MQDWGGQGPSDCEVHPPLLFIYRVFATSIHITTTFGSVMFSLCNKEMMSFGVQTLQANLMITES